MTDQIEYNANSKLNSQVKLVQTNKEQSSLQKKDLQTETGVEKEAPMSFTEYVMASNIINVIIVFIFVVWAVKKANFISVIIDKQKKVKETVEKSENKLNNAQILLANSKKAVSNTDEEIKTIHFESKEVAANITARIKEETKLNIQEVHKKAEKTIKSDAAKASGEISSEITKAAFLIAEKHIKEAVDERLQHKYINEFIDSLAGLKVK